ncbi:biotin--[acetyl-CoA-carboxylase] ligase [Kocuria massiliensis]|uniref:biotin--[acetyl-CoA-carboxylase] ligase n=1 Tax=Kocuria massiliensis TaxID=1926282 RepID=UPI001179A2CD|nr:biotin--[acetyl-CoA-carboxylase] ligase [Kocuria massiliensis]
MSMTSTTRDPLDAERLLPGGRQDERLGSAPVELLDEIDSTNDECARRWASGQTVEHLTALLTEHQVSGHGRRDRVWNAPRYSSAVVSFAVASRWGEAVIPNDSLHWVTQMLALATRTAVREVTGLPAAMKWPNDVLIHGQKIAGILARVVPVDSTTLNVVVGVGINVNIDADELPFESATSLATECGGTVDRTEILIRVIAEFRRMVTAFGEAGGDPSLAVGGLPSLLDQVRQNLDTLGRRVRVERVEPEPPLVGMAVGIADDGSLLVRPDAGDTVTVSVGDVVHLRPESGSWSDGDSR